jgi:hypothetical protein
MEGLGTTTGRWEVELRREQQPRLRREQQSSCRGGFLYCVRFKFPLAPLFQMGEHYTDRMQRYYIRWTGIRISYLV